MRAFGRTVVLCGTAALVAGCTVGEVDDVDNVEALDSALSASNVMYMYRLVYQ